MKRNAFTLAEMMVVMLIMTIVLAMAAPLMTKKRMTDLSNSSPWDWVGNTNGTVAYFLGEIAMIGEHSKGENDYEKKSQFIIKQKNNATYPITFKKVEGTNTNYLNMAWNTALASASAPYSLRFGGPYSSTSTGRSNTAFGIDSMVDLSSGQYNTAFGQGSLKALRSGSNNTAFGQGSMNALVSGSYNTAFGHSSLYSLTTGSSNIAIGDRALYKSTEGAYNVAVGPYALAESTTAQYNVAVGFKSQFYNTEGSYNIAVGGLSLQDNNTGNNNIAIGYNALSFALGSHNIGIGHGACYYVKGSNKTCIGTSSGPAYGTTHTTSSDKIIYLGDADTEVIIPGKLTVNRQAILGKDSGVTYMRVAARGNNSVERVGSFSFAECGSGWGWCNRGTINQLSEYSDKRLKNISGESKAGLDKIRELRVFNYTFKKDENKTPHVGVIAQDLEKVFPDAVTKGDDGYLMIRMEDMFYSSINAIKELDNFVQGIINEIKVVYEKITGIDKRVQALEKENKQLKEANKHLEKSNKQLQKQMTDIDKRLKKLESHS